MENKMPLFGKINCRNLWKIVYHSQGLLLIPITLVLAMLLPGNTVLPVADLASTAYFISMATIIHKGKFGRTLITGTVIMAIVLLIASYFAPQITNFAASGAVSIPDGAASISALSAGNIYAFLINLIFKTTWLGLIICLVIIVTLIIWNKKYLASKESKAETAIVNGTDAETYLNK